MCYNKSAPTSDALLKPGLYTYASANTLASPRIAARQRSARKQRGCQLELPGPTLRCRMSSTRLPCLCWDTARSRRVWEVSSRAVWFVRLTLEFDLTVVGAERLGEQIVDPPVADVGILYSAYQYAPRPARSLQVKAHSQLSSRRSSSAGAFAGASRSFVEC
jgi:hypothetical protein